MIKALLETGQKVKLLGKEFGDKVWEVFDVFFDEVQGEYLYCFYQSDLDHYKSTFRVPTFEIVKE